MQGEEGDWVCVCEKLSGREIQEKIKYRLDILGSQVEDIGNTRDI